MWRETPAKLLYAIPRAIWYVAALVSYSRNKLCLCFSNIGEEACTMNVHILLHIANCVHCWGPLWAYSAFSLENMDN